MGIICVGNHWAPAGGKWVLIIYFSIGEERKQNSHTLEDKITTREIKILVEEAFIRHRNLTFDRLAFLITKHESCSLEKKEETIIRKVFISNLVDPNNH